MNKFITTDPGGLPLQSDDLRFIDDSNRNALAGLGAALPGAVSVNDSYILQGVEVTVVGPNLDVSAGYVYYNGEVIQVDAHTVADGGIAVEHFFKLVTSFDPAGLKTFQDLSSNNTYQLRRVELTNANIDAYPGVGLAFDFNRVDLEARSFKGLLGFNSWGRVEGAFLELFIKLNDNIAGTGTEYAPLSLGAGSYFKLLQIGKTVHYDFYLNEIEMLPTAGPPGPTYYNANSITINLLPPAKDLYTTDYNIAPDNYTGPIGRFSSTLAASANKLILEVDYYINAVKENPEPINNEIAIEYNDPGPAAIFTPSTPTVNPKVTVRGSGTYETT